MVNPGGDLDGLAAAQRLRVGGDGVDLHADDLDLRSRRLDRDRDAAGQAPATDRDDDLGQIGHVVEQLEAERPLAGDDVGVVERVHEGHAGLLRARPGRRHALLHAGAADDARSLPARRTPRSSTTAPRPA